MEITVESIKKRFPEFVFMSDEAIETAITEAKILMGSDPNRWCCEDIYYLALQYLTAHFAKSNEDAAAGDDVALAPVRRTAVDNVEVDYAVNTNYGFMDSEFASTTYGRRFLFYRNMCFTGGIVV